MQQINANYDEGRDRALELCNCLYLRYVSGNYKEKVKLLKLVASNYTLNDVTLAPTYRKPFSFYAKGLPRSKWLPVLDDFRSWLN